MSLSEALDYRFPRALLTASTRCMLSTMSATLVSNLYIAWEERDVRGRGVRGREPGSVSNNTTPE